MQVHNPLTNLVFTSEQYGLEQVIINSSHKFMFLIKWGFLIETIVSLPLLQVFGNRLYFVGDKANGRISKQSTPNFPKTNIPYTLIRTCTYASCSIRSCSHLRSCRRGLKWGSDLSTFLINQATEKKYSKPFEPKNYRKVCFASMPCKMI